MSQSQIKVTHSAFIIRMFDKNQQTAELRMRKPNCAGEVLNKINGDGTPYSFVSPPTENFQGKIWQEGDQVPEDSNILIAWRNPAFVSVVLHIEEKKNVKTRLLLQLNGLLFDQIPLVQSFFALDRSCPFSFAISHPLGLHWIHAQKSLSEINFDPATQVLEIVPHQLVSQLVSKKSIREGTYAVQSKSASHHISHRKDRSVVLSAHFLLINDLSRKRLRVISLEHYNATFVEDSKLDGLCLYLEVNNEFFDFSKQIFVISNRSSKVSSLRSMIVR